MSQRTFTGKTLKVLNKRIEAFNKYGHEITDIKRYEERGKWFAVVVFNPKR